MLNNLLQDFKDQGLETIAPSIESLIEANKEEIINEVRETLQTLRGELNDNGHYFGTVTFNSSNRTVRDACVTLLTEALQDGGWTVRFEPNSTLNNSGYRLNISAL